MKVTPSRVYKFNPIIYPRLLWVVYGNNFEKVKKEFCYTSGNQLDFDPEKSDGCVAKVIHKETKKLGVLVWISGTVKSEEIPDIISHEATHAALDILYDIGFNLDYENQEPIAYLIQFIFKSAMSVVKKR